MLGQVVRRAAQPTLNRAGQVRKMSGGNPVNDLQRFYQKGSTPYLRGEADPTYLRKGSDKAVSAFALGLGTVGVVMVFYNQYRLITGQK